MLDLSFTFAISSFVAGVLMFLAPCTLPLVPAYIAFIGGVRQDEVTKDVKNRRKIRISALAFVFGFSVIFISFGILAGFAGSFAGPYRVLLSQIGGVFIVVFGLMMLNVIHFIPLARDYKLRVPKWITPGEPASAFLIGAVFALGWTPCVGPVLASVLLMATTKATVASGALLLTLFSAGLAVPFLATAILYAHAGDFIAKYATVSRFVSMFGGVLLVGIGLLLLFGHFGLTVQYGYQFLEFFGISDLLRYY